MKLIRFSNSGADAGAMKIGVEQSDGRRIDVSAFGGDYDEQFFGNNGLARLAEWLKEHKGTCPEVSPEAHLGPPCARPSKIICVGLNYAKHAAESGMAVPTEPVIFYKSTTAIVGPYDDIVIPKNSQKTDWEVELAVVIGRRASYVSETDAMGYIAGYVLHNDISERAFQLERGGQWLKGKGCDTFAPLGPFIATADEIPDPNNLSLWLKVNGKVLQDSNTADFIFNVAECVSHISQFMTLLPGDIISTGTPAGVGMGLKPPRYLQSGDVVELGIEGLGVSRQQVKAYGE